MIQEKLSADSLIGTVPDGTHRIERLLSHGGMAAVYEARQLRLDKRVAVKVISRELAANPEALDRFRREARITSGLGHPHIVQVSDFSTTPAGEPFLVMELLEGEDLAHRLDRVGRLPPAEVSRIVKQVGSALAATHAKAIVHRDLKPGNIFLVAIPGEPDFVKVLDFGISKVRSEPTALTGSLAILGTPHYMSPEQARGKTDEVDESTDQWALACIAWECLSGERPFLGENVPSVLYQIVHQPPPPFPRAIEGLDPQLEAVFVRALSKDKADRFPKVTDFVVALVAALKTSPAPSPGSPSTIPFGGLGHAASPVAVVPRSESPESPQANGARGQTKSSPLRTLAIVLAAAAALIAATVALFASPSSIKPTSAQDPAVSSAHQSAAPPPPPAPLPQAAAAAVTDKAPPEATQKTAMPSLPSTERSPRASASKSKLGASRSTRTPTKLHSKEDPWRVD
jgi:serine/threonine-protein kinase